MEDRAVRYKSQQLDIPLVKGLEGSIESRVQQPGPLAAATNVVIEKPGRFAKRPPLKYDGTLVGHDGSSVSGEAHRLGERDGAQVRLDANGAYEYLSNADRYKSLGPYPEAGYPERQVISRSADKGHAWSAGLYLNGYRIFVWVEEATSGNYIGNLWSSVHDANGVLVLRELLATSTAARPRLFAVGSTTAVVVWHEGTGPSYDVNGRTLSLSSIPAAWGSTANLWTATLSSEQQWDACGDANAVYAAIYDAGSPNTVKVLRFDSSLTSTHGHTLNVTADQTLGIFSDATSLWIGWGDSTASPASLYYAVLDCSDLSSVLTPTLIYGSSGHTFESVVWNSVDSSTAFVAFTSYRTLGPYGFACRQTHVGTVSIAGVLAGGEVTQWMQIASRVLKYNSKFYFIAQQQSLVTSFESAYYLVEAPTTGYLLRPVAALVSGGLAPIDLLSSYRQRAEISAVSSSSFMWAGREAYTFEDGILGTPGTTSWSWSMHADDGQIMSGFGGSTYLSGGLVSQIDGPHVAEAGFAYSPQITHVSVTSGSATWIYAFSYIWLDNEGKLHESALGPTAYSMGQIQVGVTKTSAATPVTCSVQTLSLTNRQRGGAGSTLTGNPLAVRVYRTTDGNPVLQFVGDYPMDPTDATVTITDNTSDATLASRPAAYTEGALPFGQCLAARHLAVFDNRIAAAVDTGARFSTQAAEDRAPQFIDNAAFSVATRDGSATKALAVMDDALLMFKRDRIYVQPGGNGPGPNGSPVYPEPRLLSTDTGCSNPLSVVSTPAGVFFEGYRGLYISPRGFSGVSWAGKRAREILRTYPYIMGSALHPERGLAIWSVMDSSTRSASTNGALLVLDYEHGEWLTWEIGFASPADAIASVGSKLWIAGGAETYVDDGSSTHVNSGEGYVTSTITTEKIHPANLITGFARVGHVRILGEYRATCKLKVEANVNETGWNYSKTWTLPEGSESAGARILKEWALPIQKLDTIQLRLTDLVNGESGATEGTVIHSITLDVAARSAGRPLHSAARG